MSGSSKVIYKIGIALYVVMLFGLSTRSPLAEIVVVQEGTAQEQTPGSSLNQSTTLSFETTPSIVAINPNIAEVGSLVTIELKGTNNFSYKRPISVLFDGARAVPQINTVPGLLVVKVPEGLTMQNIKPKVYVTFEGQEPIRFKGYFDVTFPEPASLQFPPLQNDKSYLVVGSALSLGAIIAILLAYFSYRRNMKSITFNMEKNLSAILDEEHRNKYEAQMESDIELEPLNINPPVIPDELVKAMADGRCIAYVGAGMGAQAGLPEWSEVLETLFKEAKNIDLINEISSHSLQYMFDRKQYEEIADTLINIFREHDQSLQKILKRLYLENEIKPSPAHEVLANLPVSAVVTTNLDNLLERALEMREMQVITPQNAEEGLNALSRKLFFLLKLSGQIGVSEKFTLSPLQHADLKSDNYELGKILDQLTLSRTIFFVGVSIEGVEDFFRSGTRSGRAGNRHFALVAATDHSWLVKAQFLEDYYGVTVIPFDFKDRGVAVHDFLSNLYKKVMENQRSTSEQSEYNKLSEASHLSRVVLKNIGPFDDLDIELNPNWNLLLGDNGVGKSTVLKAIAVGLVGESAMRYAERIIKMGAKSAEIALHTNTGKVYKTILKKRSDISIEMESVPLPGLEGEGWLALGFPALRSVTWDRSDVDSSLGTSRPVAADLLPLINNRADPRLDDLKQRIVTLDHMRLNYGETFNNYDRLIKDLFDLFNEITEGTDVRLKAVNPQTREIIVETEDGDIPFEALSQGTISLISWTGVLLQRLYEVTEQDRDPLQCYALVLIDELDAHMHPTWQQTIVERVNKIFPNVQFIAATHSPLVVRGMDVQSVLRFKRGESGKVEIVDIPDDMTMGRPDQVLAGSLFDVSSRLDPLTEDTIEQYQTLIGKSKRTPEEQEELDRLKGILEFRIPTPETTPSDRRARELLKALLQEQVHSLMHGEAESEELTAQNNKIKEQLLDRADRLFEELNNEKQRRQ